MDGWVDFSHEITPSTPKSTPVLHPNSGVEITNYTYSIVYVS